MDGEIAQRNVGLPAPAFETLEHGDTDSLAPLLAAAFDQIAYGVAIVTLDREVVHANRAARAALRQCGIAIDVDCRLVAADEASRSVLDRAFATARGNQRVI